MKLKLFIVALLPILSSLLMGQPNLIVVLVDDMGWQDTGFAGNKVIETHNLDQLASDGIIFSQAYASAPNCAPTRACLMTGLYPPRHGVYTVVDARHNPGQPNHKIIAADSKAELAGEFVTVAESLKKAGYATGMVGMWNLGRGRSGSRVPTGQGFDSYVQPRDLGFQKDEYINSKGEYLTDCMTDTAIEFVQKSNGPFFLYFASHAIHAPFQPKRELTQKYGGDEAGKYAATVEALDHNIGRLAKVLPDNTILIFTSDNGGTRRFVEPLRGGKGTLYEGGVRVPAFAVGKGIRGNQVSDEPISTIDIYPTLLELAGIPAPEATDGKSLVPLWTGGSLNRDSLYWHFPCYIGNGSPSSAMRKGDYKIIESFESGKVELYDLSKDPEERRDLAIKEPELTASLYNDLKDWQARTNAPRPSKPNPKYDPTVVQKRGRDQRGKGDQNQRGQRDKGERDRQGSRNGDRQNR